MRIHAAIVAMQAHRPFTVNIGAAYPSTEQISGGCVSHHAGESTARLANPEKKCAQSHGRLPAEAASADALLLAQTELQQHINEITGTAKGTRHHKPGAIDGAFCNPRSRRAPSADMRVYRIETFPRQCTELDAMQTRLARKAACMATGAETLSGVKAPIRDMDTAVEVAKYTRTAILNQASVAALSQANSAKRRVLRLLK